MFLHFMATRVQWRSKLKKAQNWRLDDKTQLYIIFYSHFFRLQSTRQHTCSHQGRGITPRHLLLLQKWYEDTRVESVHVSTTSTPQETLHPSDWCPPCCSDQCGRLRCSRWSHLHSELPPFQRKRFHSREVRVDVSRIRASTTQPHWCIVRQGDQWDRNGIYWETIDPHSLCFVYILSHESKTVLRPRQHLGVFNALPSRHIRSLRDQVGVFERV